MLFLDRAGTYASVCQTEASFIWFLLLDSWKPFTLIAVDELPHEQ